MCPKGRASSWLRRGNPFTKEEYIIQAEMYLHLHRIFINQGKVWGRRNGDIPAKIQREQYCAILSMLGYAVSRGMPSLTLTTWQPRHALKTHKGTQLVAWDGGDQGPIVQCLEEHDARRAAWDPITKRFAPAFVARLMSEFQKWFSNVVPAVANNDDDLELSDAAKKLLVEVKMYLHINGTYKWRYAKGDPRAGGLGKESAATRKQLAVIIERDVYDTSVIGRWEDGEQEKEMEKGLSVRNLSFVQMERKWRLFRDYVEDHDDLLISDLDEMVKCLRVGQVTSSQQSLNWRSGTFAKRYQWEQQLWHWAFQQAYIKADKGQLWGKAWRNKLLLKAVLIVRDESDDDDDDNNDGNDDDNNDGDDGNNGNWGGDDDDDDDYSASSSSSVNNGDHLRAMARKEEAARRSDDDDDEYPSMPVTKFRPSRKPLKLPELSLEEFLARHNIVSSGISSDEDEEEDGQPLEEVFKAMGFTEEDEEVFKALGFTKDGVEIESENESMTEYYDRMQKEEEEKARLAQMSSKEHVSEDENEETMSV
jgi:hypothetical protein